MAILFFIKVKNKMKDFIKSIKMCLSMFTTISFPCKDWDESLRNKMLEVFPFVGIYISIIFCILFRILLVFINDISIYLISLIIALYPYFATGFIHLDGFMDVSDALSSCYNYEKMISILKDSHVGGFAVIKTVVLILTKYVATLTILLKVSKLEIEMRILPNKILKYMLLFSITFIISRIMSSIALIILKKISISEYSEKTECIEIKNIVKDNMEIDAEDNNGKKIANKNENINIEKGLKHNRIKTFNKLLLPILIFILVIIISFLISFFYINSVKFLLRVVLQVFIVLITHIFLTHKCFKNFKGVNGDVSGYAICVSECIGYIFIALL